MVKYRLFIFLAIIVAALAYSFYPTIYELSLSNQLKDKNREFILEHNYYWPDFNLYLSKIRQGTEGRWLGLERYTSEPHSGSLIQVFYVWLGQLARPLGLDPNGAYQLGRIILSPLLLIIIMLLIRFFFHSFLWQITALVITLTSGSFPHFYTSETGAVQVGRFMEWWSNIDAVQRLTFIPHILFGQVVSFFLLYQLTTYNLQLTTKKIVFFIILGNLVGLVFPPSLMTLNGVLIIILFVGNSKLFLQKFLAGGVSEGLPRRASLGLTENDYLTNNLPLKRDRGIRERQDPHKNNPQHYILFFIFTLPSLLYFLIITQQIPWSALVEFHRTHPMMIPFWEYILGTGPIFFLGIAGAVVSVIKRDSKFQSLIFWIITTFSFALLFTYVKQQSPLRFTQTGLFIPLGILGTYFFQQIWNITKVAGDPKEGLPTEASPGLTGERLLNKNNSALEAKGGIPEGQAPQSWQITIRFLTIIIITFYILENLYMTTVSMRWQTDFITQRVRASIPPVAYPPQTMYPLRQWMDGIRWLADNTSRGDVVLAEITAGNFIPAYSGNTVYFGQANTVDYEQKQAQVDRFFRGEIIPSQIQIFIKNSKIKYIFYSIQEKEMASGNNLVTIYPGLFSAQKRVFQNEIVTIYDVAVQ